MVTVIDLSSRRVVGWVLSDHMRTSLVEDALAMAFAQRRPAAGVIFHSDRVQHPAAPFRTAYLTPAEYESIHYNAARQAS
jgi:putative transposase